LIREATSAELIKIWDSSQKLSKIFTSFDNFKLYHRKQCRSVFVNVNKGDIRGNAVIGFWKDQKDTIAIWDLLDYRDYIVKWVKYLKIEASSHNAKSIAIIDPHAEIVDILLKSGFKLFNSVSMLQCQCISISNFNNVAQLKKIRKKDFPTILKIDDKCFLKFWKVSGGDIKRIFNDPKRKVYAYLAIFERRYTGYIVGGGNGEEGNIGRIAVLPDFQGLGIGRQMLATVLREMSADGIQRVTTHTQFDNEKAKALYKDFGFRETGLGFDIYLADI
jgi:ribosomal-protein-alanine N-acetyltransferase